MNEDDVFFWDEERDDGGIWECDGGDGARTGFWGVVGHGGIIGRGIFCSVPGTITLIDRVRSRRCRYSVPWRVGCGDGQGRWMWCRRGSGPENALEAWNGP